jgi:hypothetical protein
MAEWHDELMVGGQDQLVIIEGTGYQFPVTGDPVTGNR